MRAAVSMRSAVTPKRSKRPPKAIAHTANQAQLLDRARPTLNPVAETLGPSLPSGHSSTAAAFFAAAALVLGCRRSSRTRAALAGGAVGLAVAVACSRVLLEAVRPYDLMIAADDPVPGRPLLGARTESS